MRCRRHATPPNPARPEASKRNDVGSGTAEGGSFAMPVRVAESRKKSPVPEETVKFRIPLLASSVRPVESKLIIMSKSPVYP